MDEKQHQRLLDKYFVPHMGLYTEPGGEVATIVRKLESGTTPSPTECRFLRDKGLRGLSAFAEHFAATGNRDRRLLRTVDDRRREAIHRSRALRERYMVEFIEEDNYPKMMAILRKVDGGGRLPDEDVVWLEATGYFTPALKRVFHRNEAEHHRKLFESSQNPHEAVSANSHYRKAGTPNKGLEVLSALDFEQQTDARLRSALYTTKGGALRDLRRCDEAMQCAEKGHAHNQASFHPCTLLGALHYEAGNHALGDEWFAKAIDRGAKPGAVDAELHAIWKRSSPQQRADMRQHLLGIDPIRYRWASDSKRQACSSREAKALRRVRQTHPSPAPAHPRSRPRTRNGPRPG